MIKLDRFYGGKKHAVTFSYDDGREFDRRLVEIFNKYNIKATFHLNSNRFGCDGYVTKEEIADLYAGHEVSVHTMNHPFLERELPLTVTKEILGDRLNLEKLCGYPVRGMSYPFGTYSKDVIDAMKACGIVYSRTVNSTQGFNIPSDFMTWNPTCHHCDALKCTERFLSELNFPWRSGLLYIWGHSYEFDNNNNWELIEETCRKLSGNDDIWYATNIEIYDYITAQKSLITTVDDSVVYNPSALTLWFSVDGVTYEIKPGETLKIN